MSLETNIKAPVLLDFNRGTQPQTIMRTLSQCAYIWTQGIPEVITVKLGHNGETNPTEQYF